MDNIIEQPAEGAAEKNSLEFLGTKEIAACLGCSIPTAREIMHRHDFPLIQVGRALRVSRSAFERWASERRV